MKLFEIEERSVLSVMGQQPSHYDGDFICSDNKLTSLEGCPQSVGGNFNCSHNKLTSLVGGPQSVWRDFFCHANNLISLVGAPRSVNGDFDCGDNKLTSLEHAPQTINGAISCWDNNIKSFHNVHKHIKQINGDFHCGVGTHMLGIALIKGIQHVFTSDDKLTQIFNQYLHDVHMLQEALIDGGYRQQAQL